MALSRQEREHYIDELAQLPEVRELCSRYVEENPEATNDPFLLIHAFIAPLYRPEVSPDDWSEPHSWAFLIWLLAVGMRTGKGMRLSPAECGLLHQMLMGKRKLKRQLGRRRGSKRNRQIEDFLELLGPDDVLTKAAVADIRDKYQVARSTVFAAKRNRKKQTGLQDQSN
jgi:hypothetical protein